MSGFTTYANSFQAVSRLRLEGIARLCDKLGEPQRALRFIHVAGTNGKGSVCAFLQSILTLSGKRCGKFISPNMLRVTERISVDGRDISSADMQRIMNTVEPVVREIEAETGDTPTQFEIWTAAAFVYFKEQRCDVVVLETGLGGRLDATNIIEKNLCAVITPIGIDHTAYLGNTLEKIAVEKAGIIKPACPVITARQAPEAMRVIENACAERESELRVSLAAKNIRTQGGALFFDTDNANNIEVGLQGLYQAENAALALTVARFLNIDEQTARRGLLRARNIGRFELLCAKPPIIFDGAHNESGLRALTQSVKSRFKNAPLSIVYAAMADKDLAAAVRVFRECGFDGNCSFYTVTVKDNPRAQTAPRLCEALRENGFCAEACENVSAALCAAFSKGKPTIVCGSLYLYKDIADAGLDFINI